MHAHGNTFPMGKNDVNMGNGLNYILRLFRGESPQSILQSMTEEDYAKFQAVTSNLKESGLNRQQRRKIERKMKTVKR